MRPLICVVGRRAAKVTGLRFAATVAAEAIGEAVFRAGGEPAILHGGDRGALGDLPGRLTRFGGVLLPGGGDLDPAHYGREPHPATDPDDPDQDALDLAVARAVLAAGLPTLAICRGLQVVNAVRGGTLVQHLPPGHLDVRHEVTAVPGSRLAALVGTAPITVSSYHHQSVDRPGRDLRVVARSPDGGIEALEDGDLLAVQWHPEDLAAESAPDHALFADLVSRSTR